MRIKGSAVRNPNDFVTHAGDKYHILYRPIVLPDGSIRLRESDRIDIQAEINSYRDTTDMAFILSRLKIGDGSVLNQKPAMYGDFTSVPKSMAEVMQMAIDAEASFLKLPLSVRQQYGNNFRAWFADAGSETWNQVMSAVLNSNSSSTESVDAKAESEVSTSES